MREMRLKYGLFAGAIILQGLVFFYLPVLGSGVFSSPDETAVAVSARDFGTKGSMRIQNPLLADFPWLHPRSFVTQGDSIVPVGFLGMPVLLGVIWKFLGEFGLLFFVPLLAMSAAFPIWRFAKSLGVYGQLFSVMAWLSFPTVILYANRGLFPNLPVVCLTSWSAYLIWERRTEWKTILAGIIFGLAASIRPLELMWMIPWIGVAWRLREEPKRHQERKTLALFTVSAIVVGGIFSFIAWKVYGSPFAVGYFLRDPIISTSENRVTAVVPTTSSVYVWPFGFHPRNVMYNLRTYVAGYLGPWASAIIGAWFVLWRKKRARLLLWLSGWTLAVLGLVYGQGIYQDHVGVNVSSTGNSFLRYLLPLAPICALAVGVVFHWCQERVAKRRGLVFVASLMALLVGTGMWTALNRDDEGLQANAQQLAGYAQIRVAAMHLLDPRTIVLSDRSDKIFFPAFTAVSPIPSPDAVLRLVASDRAPVAIYSQTLDQAALDHWMENDIELQPLMNAGRETLYLAHLPDYYNEE